LERNHGGAEGGAGPRGSVTVQLLGEADGGSGHDHYRPGQQTQLNVVARESQTRDFSAPLKYSLVLLLHGWQAGTDATILLLAIFSYTRQLLAGDQRPEILEPCRVPPSPGIYICRRIAYILMETTVKGLKADGQGQQLLIFSCACLLQSGNQSEMSPVHDV
jgi:hypothetical protein